MSNFLRRVEDNCKKYPNRMAFEDEHRSISYKQLWEDSGRIYNWLNNQEVGKEKFCVFVLPKSVFSMVCILGAIRTGCAFCNLDNKMPEDRINYIINDLDAIRIIDEYTYEQIMKEDPREGYENADIHDAAFAVYTSGSTGNPKGVLHEYGNIDMCLSLYPEEDEYKEMHAALTAPFYSVASVLLAINCMAVARSTHIVSEYLLRDFVGMSRFLVEKKIRDTFLPPSYLRIYKEPSPYLEQILTGAERADGIYYEGGKPEILNYYSMSEAGFPLLIYKLDKRYDEAPVGVPVITGIDLHLEGEQGNRIEGAGEGEIVFKDPFVRGYINLPEKTNEVFRDGYFHTKDVARRDEKGLYYIVGRADDMIKIAGNRVEPGEIETCFKRITGKDVCCVKGFKNGSETILALYYQGEILDNKKTVKEKMNKELPSYMIPSHFVHLDSIPVMEHGKIDKKKLPDPTLSVKDYEEPINEIEAKLCETMKKVLEVDKVGRNDSFLDLGGSSLTAISVVAEAGIEGLNVIDIYKGDTVKGIAQLVRNRRGTFTSTKLDEMEKEARKIKWPVTAVQKGMLRHLESHIDSKIEHYVFLVSIPIIAGVKTVAKTVKQLIKHHAVFGTVFEKDGEDNYLEYYDESLIKYPEIEHMKDKDFEEFINKPCEKFELFGKPLAKVRIIVTGLKINVIFTFHHLIFDGNSLQVIANNFEKMARKGNVETDTFFAFLAEQNSEQHKKDLAVAKNYLERKFSNDKWCWNIPGQFNEREDIGIMKNVTSIPIKKLDEICKRYNITRSIFCGSLLALLLAKMNRSDKVLFSSLFDGRTDLICKNAAGPVFQKIAVGVDLEKCQNIIDLFESVNNAIGEGIANCAYNWCDENSIPYQDEAIDFVYDSEDMMKSEAMSKFAVTIRPIIQVDNKSLNKSIFGVMESNGFALINLVYSARSYSDEEIDEAAKYLNECVNYLVDHEHNLEQVSIKEMRELKNGI